MPSNILRAYVVVSSCCKGLILSFQLKTSITYITILYIYFRTYIHVKHNIIMTMTMLMRKGVLLYVFYVKHQLNANIDNDIVMKHNIFPFPYFFLLYLIYTHHHHPTRVIIIYIFIRNHHRMCCSYTPAL